MIRYIVEVGTERNESYIFSLQLQFLYSAFSFPSRTVYERRVVALELSFYCKSLVLVVLAGKGSRAGRKSVLICASHRWKQIWKYYGGKLGGGVVEEEKVRRRREVEWRWSGGGVGRGGEIVEVVVVVGGGGMRLLVIEVVRAGEL